jgi:hypothetical protein
MHSSKRAGVILGVLLGLASPARAQVAFSEFDSGGSASDVTSFTTTTLTPSASSLYLMCVVNNKASAPDTPTATGQGQTWTQVATRANAGDDARVTVFRALGGSTNGGVTVDFAGATQIGTAWKILAVTGMDTSGTNGSGALIQSVSNTANSTALTITLAALGNAANGEAACYMSKLSASTFAAEGSWVESGAEVGYTPPATTFGAMYGTPNDITATGTFGSSAAIVGIAVEIGIASGSTPRKHIIGGDLIP